MDKEAQEKLDIVHKVAGVIKSSIHISLRGTQLELWGFNLAALDSITLLENLGWKPPKDRLELVEDIDQIMLDVTGLFLVGKGTGIDLIEARNQILALIPDKPPKEKPTGNPVGYVDEH